MDPVTEADLPALFRAADQTSIGAQKNYLRLVRGDLALIVAAALCTSWAVSSPALRMALALAGAATFLGAMALTAFFRQRAYDKEWFFARALAESVKMISWKYMTRSSPYLESLADDEADELLCRELRSILHLYEEWAGEWGGPPASAQQITPRMREVRSQDLETRRAIYIRDRIQDQRQWYGTRASQNMKSSRRWLATVIVLQIVGALAAVALAVWPQVRFNLASVLAALVAAFLAWLQLKRHQKLANTYGLAAQELGLMEAREPHIHEEQALSLLVADAEDVISREHHVWKAVSLSSIG